MGAVIKQLSTRIKQEQKESDAIKTAMVAMLHDRLFQCCKHHIKNGYIPVDESEAVLDNLKLLYDTYTALGGNGTGTEMYKRTKALPIKKEV